ncbi:Asp23/Gls24 family envelope stress response protein [Actinoalloteichus fjordicus]|uniref:Asp23/Gls24 family envelope stress response protein n=1 Tax=Actinoalloteichus fjordicus TaxID=1612552 RepID=A0AAC9LH26_9PSEU|nr:Asp23/Gls24 family envelope stress response protein [Actinoalloteichus fjordicus]APU16749.1 hypothetical protein UA74_23655 [Actinoalloteichus fjordicus]
MSTVASRGDGRPVRHPVHRDAGRDDTGSAGLPGDRGALTIAPVVFRKLVRHAAEEIPEVLPDRHGSRGVRVRHHGGPAAGSRGRRGGRRDRRRTAAPSRGGDGPRTEAADAVRVRLSLALRYPCSIRETAWRIRERVIAEVGRLTGTPVHSVDIIVHGLRGRTVPRVR